MKNKFKRSLAAAMSAVLVLSFPASFGFADGAAEDLTPDNGIEEAHGDAFVSNDLPSGGEQKDGAAVTNPDGAAGADSDGADFEAKPDAGTAAEAPAMDGKSAEDGEVIEVVPIEVVPVTDTETTAAVYAARGLGAVDTDDEELLTYMTIIESGKVVGTDCADEWGTYNKDGELKLAATAENTDQETAAVKFDVKKTTTNGGGAVRITTGQDAAINAGELQNAFIKMTMYTKGQARNLPSTAELTFGGSETKTITVDFPKADVTQNEWTTVSIPMGSCASELKGEVFLEKIELRLPSSLTQIYSIYVSDMKVLYEHKEYINAKMSMDDGAVLISWESSFEADSYKVYCNGEEIADTTDKLFRYVPSEWGKQFAFRVDGYKDGALAASSEEMGKFLYSPDREVVFPIICEDGSYGPNMIPASTATGFLDEKTWKVPGGVVQNGDAPTGANSIKYTSVYPTDKEENRWQMRLGFSSGNGSKDYYKTDFSGWLDGYIEFFFYAEEGIPSDFSMRGQFYDTSAAYSATIEEMHKWYYIKIPFADMSNVSQLRTDKPIRIQMNFASNVTHKISFRIADMCITVPRKATTVSYKDSGIDNSGKAYTDIEFSREMDKTTVGAAAFTIGGKSASAVEWKDSKKARVLFDSPFDFPSEYTLKMAADGMFDSEKRSLKDSEIEFKTRGYQPDIIVTLAAKFDKTTAGRIGVSADIKAVYKGKNKNVSGKMIAAAVKNDKIVAVAESEIFTANVGDTKTITAELLSDKLTSDCKVSVYFVSADSDERPLCESENK